MTNKKKPSKVKPGTSKASHAERVKIFIETYITNGGNGTQAAITAGYSPKTADSQASRLLRDVKIKAQVEARQAKLVDKYALTTEALIRSMAQAVFFDPRKLYDENGQLKPITELDDDTAAALAGFEVTFESAKGRKGDVDDVITGVKKVKWLDKNTAREQANKHLGLYEKDNKQKTDAVDRLLERISGNALLPVDEHR